MSRLSDIITNIVIGKAEDTQSYNEIYGKLQLQRDTFVLLGKFLKVTSTENGRTETTQRAINKISSVIEELFPLDSYAELNSIECKNKAKDLKKLLCEHNFTYGHIKLNDFEKIIKEANKIAQKMPAQNVQQTQEVAPPMGESYEQHPSGPVRREKRRGNGSRRGAVTGTVEGSHQGNMCPYPASYGMPVQGLDYDGQGGYGVGGMYA